MFDWIKKNIKLLPIIVFLLISPLLVTMFIKDLSYIEEMMTNQVTASDFFSLGRAYFMLGITLVILMIFILDGFATKDLVYYRRTWFYLPVGIYTLMVIVSTFVGKYLEYFASNFSGASLEGENLRYSIAVWGYWERYEGMLAILGYVILLLYVVNYIRKSCEIKVILDSLYISTFIVCLIGLSQFFGFDFYQTSVGKYFMLPGKYAAYREFVDFHFGSGTIYATLYNTNYVGTYMAMLFPLSFVTALNENSRNKKIMYYIVTILIITNLFGSNSLTGLVAFITALVVVLVAMYRQIYKDKIYIVGLIVFSLLFLLIMDISSGRGMSKELGLYNNLTTENVSVLHKDKIIDSVEFDGLRTTINGADERLTIGIDSSNQLVFLGESGQILPYINMRNNFIEWHIDQAFLGIMILENSIQLLDYNYKGISMTSNGDDKKYVINDPMYSMYVVEVYESFVKITKDENYIQINFDDDGLLTIDSELGELFAISSFEENALQLLRPDTGRKESAFGKILLEDYMHYYFEMNSEGNYLRANISGKNLNIYYVNNESYLISSGGYLSRGEDVTIFQPLKGRENFGSNRGYIWSRSIPILKNTIFIGTGPDTYPVVFPQNDVVGKLNYLYGTQIIVDKPHNMYLQMGINTGMISLLAFLTLVLGYLLLNINIFWKKKDDYFDYINVAVVAAVSSYLVAGIANDSVISVAPIFWIILGIGISITISKRELKAEA